MKPEFKEHIKNIIGKLTTEDTAEYNDKLCFLKHYSSFNIDEEDIINIIATLNINCDMFYYRFDETEMQGAYCPFLTFIRELYIKYYSDVECREFVNNAGIYRVVEDIFTSYIKQEYCERSEDIIQREVPYERERIIESIVNIFKYISDEHKMVIVLDGLQRAQESTIRLLISMMKNTKIKNIVIIGAYNEARDVNSYMKDSWNIMAGYIKDRELAIDYDDNRRNIEIDEAFIPETSMLEIYFRNINDMFLCLALNQAKYYLDIIYRAIESDNLEADDRQKIEVLKLYALVAVYNGEEKVAYVYCKKMYDIEYIQRDKEKMFEFNYISALINQKSGQRSVAHTFINEARKIAEELEDKKLQVKIDMLELIVILDRFPDVLLWNPNADMPKHLVQVAEDNNQKLHLTYAYIFGFNMPEDISSCSEEGKIGCENIEECRRGMELAKELGNIQIQIRAWQKNAIQASTSGRFDETVYYYGQCLKIMEGQDRKHEEAQIYNGIGYNCLINEKYDMAYEYFLRAVKIGIAVDTPKYILDAVYNMAITGITVGDYSATIKYVNITLKMMTILKIERLNVCNKTKLYGLAIFSYVKLKQVYNAKLYFDIMETSMQHILSVNNPDYSMWEDDIYLYYAVSGMIAFEDENYAEARKNYRLVQKIWEKISSKQNYILPKVIEEEAKLYEVMGEKDIREKILRQTIEFCRNNMLIHNAEKLELLINGETPEEDKPFKNMSDEIVSEIFKMTNRCELKKEVEKKNKMLTFFENWVESLNDKFESVDAMISSSMLMIKNTFDVDCIVNISIQNGTPVVRYCDREIELKTFQLKYIVDYFNENRRRILISRFQKSYQYHEELISAFGRDDIASMLAIPFISKDTVSEIFVTFKLRKLNFTENLVMFYEDDADVLRTACRELIESINKERIKKELEKSSVTDILTGLYNRQGMKKNIENELNVGGKQQFTIMYMDLDNFKYCNDNFGHEAGDAVLVAFSRMLEGIVEDNGYIIRYGGDEFIIVLTNKGSEYGVEIAEKIFANIRHNKGFKKTIEILKKEEINISEKNRITCSIGISTGKTSSYQGIGRILKHADEALYNVKNNTKHNYKVWNSNT